MRLTRLAVPLAVSLVAVSAAAAAHARAAAVPGWSRISGPTEPGVQLGLARGTDGVLHVIWNRGARNTSIFETRISPAGATVGTSTVATGWDGNEGLALLRMPDGSLRLFASGATHAGSSLYGIMTLTAPAAGGSWSLQGGAWGGAVASSAGIIGAALTRDGQPVTAWRGYAVQGFAPSVPQNGFQGGMTASQLATDGGSGAVVLSGATNAGQGGIYVQQVLPGTGAKVVLPMPGGENDWNSSISGRLGAPGVYVAYADGKAARLYRYGGGTTTLARGLFSSAAVCAGPAGRLWLAWGDRTDGLFVTRTSMGAGALEPVQHLRLPQGTQDGLTFVQCEGSAGPLDLFADATIGTQQGFWHAHVLARLSVGGLGAKGKATFTVRDAGDPVAGAIVVVARHHVSTSSSGQATVTLPRGSYTATVSAPGYASASAKVSVR